MRNANGGRTSRLKLGAPRITRQTSLFGRPEQVTVSYAIKDARGDVVYRIEGVKDGRVPMLTDRAWSVYKGRGFRSLGEAMTRVDAEKLVEKKLGIV